MLLFEINYVIKGKIDEVYLLCENHNDSEKFDHFGIKNIYLLDNIDECICGSDCIMIIKDGYIPDSIIEYIERFIFGMNKQLIILDNLTKYDRPNILEFNIVDFPIIYTVSVGSVTQQYCIEILINKILSENYINFFQIFSESTQTFLHQLCSYGIINDTIEKNLHMTTNNYNLLVLSESFAQEELIKIIDRIKLIKPDYIIFQINDSFSKHENLNKMIRYGSSREIDNLIISEYISVSDKNNDYIAYSNRKRHRNFKVFYIDDNELENKLFFDILSKIALPNGIRRINY
jgi:hypothetical protein